MPPMEKLRLDKWLWAARFYKTRSLATEQVDKGRVQVNGAAVKPSRDLRVGDTVRLRQELVERTVEVLALSDVRGPAPVAQLLYRETDESVALRLKAAEQARLNREPASSIEHGRPTKRDRRELSRVGQWDQRWSASVDD